MCVGKNRAAAIAIVISGTALGLLLSRQSLAQDAAQIEAGAYIATSAGCASCHTSDPEEPYAGGVELLTPFGPIYGNNITPDDETGIGEWTLDDFRRALHEGVSADGSYIYPAMPYIYYTKMSDGDVESLWAYLQSLKPVKNTVPEPDLTFPFNVREGVGGWQALYLDNMRLEATPEKSTEWNRGGQPGRGPWPLRRLPYAQEFCLRADQGAVPHRRRSRELVRSRYQQQPLLSHYPMGRGRTCAAFARRSQRPQLCGDRPDVGGYAS